MDKDQNKCSALNGLILAIQLLTTIPLRKQVPWTKSVVSFSVAFYPLVGLILGSIVMLFAFLIVEWLALPIAISSFFLLLLIVMLTGGLHLDGWMDVSDGVFSRQNQDRKLAIMKDSRVGAFAVISLFFLLMGKYLFLWKVLELAEHFWFYFVFIPFYSRWMMSGALLFGQPARKEGMAHSVQKYIKSPSKYSFFVWGLSIFIFSFFFFQNYILVSFIFLLVSTLVLLVSFSFFRTQFGGITGDTLGTVVEGGELILWLVASLLLYYGIV